MTDSEFWAEVKANLREAYASALHWQERARVARELGDSDRERAYLLLTAGRRFDEETGLYLYDF